VLPLLVQPTSEAYVNSLYTASAEPVAGEDGEAPRGLVRKTKLSLAGCGQQNHTGSTFLARPLAQRASGELQSTNWGARSRAAQEEGRKERGFSEDIDERRTTVVPRQTNRQEFRMKAKKMGLSPKLEQAEDLEGVLVEGSLGLADAHEGWDIGNSRGTAESVSHGEHGRRIGDIREAGGDEFRVSDGASDGEWVATRHGDDHGSQGCHEEILVAKCVAFIALSAAFVVLDERSLPVPPSPFAEDLTAKALTAQPNRTKAAPVHDRSSFVVVFEEGGLIDGIHWILGLRDR